VTAKKFLSILIVLSILALFIVGCQARAGPGGGMVLQQATWTMILGLFVPIIVVGIMQLGWTKQANSLIALVITVGFAVLDAWYFGQLSDTDNLVQTVFNILITAITTYTTIWKPLGVIDWWAEKTTLRRFKFTVLGEGYGLPW
jgi:hypothetical protein